MAIDTWIAAGKLLGYIEVEPTPQFPATPGTGAGEASIAYVANSYANRNIPVIVSSDNTSDMLAEFSTYPSLATGNVAIRSTQETLSDGFTNGNISFAEYVPYAMAVFNENNQPPTLVPTVLIPGVTINSGFGHQITLLNGGILGINDATGGYHQISALERVRFNENGTITHPVNDQAPFLRGEECFPAGTPIHLWDGTTKPIETITQSDIVLTHDAQGNPAPGIVDKLFTNTTPEFVRLTFADGRDPLVATPGHRFLTETGDYMEIGQMLRLGGGRVRLTDTGVVIVEDRGETIAAREGGTQT